MNKKAGATMTDIADAYQLLRQTMGSTKELTDFLRQVEVSSTVPPIGDSPELRTCLSRGISAIHRVRFTSEEEPAETFKHPGIIVIDREQQKRMALLTAKANHDREKMLDTIADIRSSQDNTPEKNILMSIVHHHKSNGIMSDIPIIGSPDRIKLRQLTRSIRFFPNVHRVRFTLEEKSNVRSAPIEQYIEMAQERGMGLLADKLGSYKQGELKKVSKPTRRWRVALMTDDQAEVKIVTSIPVIVTPSTEIDEISVKGITDYGIEPARKRKKRTDKRELKLAIPELDLYVYE
jgi:hypothetical protein